MLKNIRLGFCFSIIFLLITACGVTQGANSSVDTEHKELQEIEKEVSEYAVVEMENNEHDLVFTEAPERAVTLNQHVTEVMLALGLEDSIVGTAYLDDEILPEFKAAYDQIPVLSDQYPSQEVFLAEEPDFAYAGWKSAFREDNVGTVEQLEEFGINAYLHESSSVVGPTIEHIFQDIRNIAKIFNVVERGEALINEMNIELEEIQANIPVNNKPVNIFVYDSGDTAPFTVGQNFLNTIIEMAGATNIFNDIDSNWGEVSWEVVVERDPEVIVIVDYGETTAEEKREQLMNHPALTDVTAILNQEFIVMPLSAAAEGVRVPSALEIIVNGLYE
ncbi:ABC transporter substrate-binding protein [Halalkalibacter alkalisediminis]|uniref:ABC transporter substrate-binding protein n=1 Tax=Halalkalibacter alkalisediminis TaxID=935616 RepID=A0ABV6NHV2_9BACI|nr:ABC transporter substrate-binding protein [Halalkalibacter alkalisediminis]